MGDDSVILTLGQAISLTSSARVITTAGTDMKIIHTNKGAPRLLPCVGPTGFNLRQEFA